MAKYDYHCRTCFTWKEVDRSIHEAEQAVVCPACQTSMKRVYSPIAIRFKSAGLYKNDSQINNFYPENGSTL